MPALQIVNEHLSNFETFLIPPFRFHSEIAARYALEMWQNS